MARLPPQLEKPRATPEALGTSNAAPARSIHVRLLYLREAMPGTLFAAVDVLRAADSILRLQRPEADGQIEWQIVGPGGKPVPMPGFMATPARRRASPPADADTHVLVVPGVFTRHVPDLVALVEGQPEVTRLLRLHHDSGGWIATCFNGIAYAAQAELLDNARVGVPWLLQSWFMRRFPHVDCGSDEAIGLHGRVFSCVAPVQQTELMLRVLGHLYDADLAQACSHMLLPQPERQRIMPPLVVDRWVGVTADSPVYRARQWLQAHVDNPYRLAEVARAAAVSERTLLRHFQQVTGATPLEYLHTLRVERAKAMLEVTLHGIHAIAQACGYADAGAFRRLFQRATGMSMSEYRAGHSLRAPRQFWRVEDAGPAR